MTLTGYAKAETLRRAGINGEEPNMTISDDDANHNFYIANYEGTNTNVVVTEVERRRGMTGGLRRDFYVGTFEGASLSKGLWKEAERNLAEAKKLIVRNNRVNAKDLDATLKSTLEQIDRADIL
ncbi:MAG: hypothetical protein AABW73_00775 [Nanoarchaeota archaeon]